jgi:hypothetical protein
MRRAFTLILIALALVGAFFVGRRMQAPHAPEPTRQDPPDDLSRAWSHVHASPSDPGAWAALGDAQAAAGDLVSAEHSYLTAIRMGGDNALAYARLGFLHYAKQEDDRAIAFLEEAKRRGSDVPMLDFTIETLEARRAQPETIEAEVKRVPDAGIDPLDAGEEDARVPEAPAVKEEIVHVDPPAPPPAEPIHDGACSIPATRIEQGRTFVVPVAVYGHWANLIIDTGASLTVVSKTFADAVRLPIDPHARIRAITANGRVEFRTAVVPEVVLANRVAENVRVAICDECVESVADGLLGLDLVAAFGMRLDLAHATVHFADCE